MLCRAVLAAFALASLTCSAVIRPRDDDAQCQQTSVLILGAGMAGIRAAKALTDQGIKDFLIVEYNGVIGGRVAHTTFGTNPAVTIELGANWVQGIKSPGGPPNPIWTLAKRYNVSNTYSDYSSILTYDQTGAVNYKKLLNKYEDAYATFEQDMGYILSENLLDVSARAGLSLAGWTATTKDRPHFDAVDWWEWDWEYAFSPEVSSGLFGVVNYNTTFYQFSDANNFVWDSRGYSTVIIGLANTFLKPSDPRLLLNTIVTKVTYDDSGVTIKTANNTCIRAKYAICTFSLGVLQAAAAGIAPVTFSPDFPRWKQQAIATFDMGIYTKIFIQFPTQFWPDDTQYFLYASPTTRGYYPVWQSLSTKGFLPGSNIIFVTVVTDQSRHVEAQDDATTQAEVLAVLRQMYGADNVPEPTAFLYPRWGQTEWAYGSYANWPIGVTLKQHQNLRANVGRLWFAGEATSTEYFGFLHGAYYEGLSAGLAVATCLHSPKKCEQENQYPSLAGTTPAYEYDYDNGWFVTSFQTHGF